MVPAHLLSSARPNEQTGIPGELSLEERMACGVGACLGCGRTTHGYKQVCREGPVFSADE